MRSSLWPVTCRVAWGVSHSSLHAPTHSRAAVVHSTCTVYRQVRQGLCLVVFTVHSRCDWGQQPPPNTHTPVFLHLSLSLTCGCTPRPLWQVGALGREQTATHTTTTKQQLQETTDRRRFKVTGEDCKFFIDWGKQGLVDRKWVIKQVRGQRTAAV